ncbi:G-protein coupled receptor 4-like [Heterodontus francisci]|uniref:G-protein coupled receptor 4-like n=1 Tax=Heterodontus francisci TaxID=7792 RepID=UPI00355B846B
MKMNSTVQCEIDIKSGRLFPIVIYSCSFVIGLPLNIIAICGLYQLRQQTGMLATYLLNLLIADLFNLVTLPLWIIYYINRMHWVFNKISCNITGFVFYCDIYVSIYFLTWTAIDRYLAIVHPLYSHGLRTKRIAIIVSVCGWLVCGSGALIFMLLFRFRENRWCFEMYPLFLVHAILRLISICIGFIIPCFILCFTYGSILRAIQRSRSLEPDEKKRIQHLLLAVGFMFIVFFSPYHITYIYRIIVVVSADDVCYHESSVAIYFHITLALMNLNNIFAPLLYIFVCGDIRRKLFSCCAQI